MNLRVILLAALVPLLGSSRSQGETLDLAGAMNRARTRAREVTAARARAEAGDRRAAEARSYRLPHVRLQEMWMRTDSPADAFGLLLNQERFSFPDFAAADPNSPDPIENALTRLEVSLPLYTGGEISARIDQARLAAAAGHDDAAWIEEQAALAAAEAYIDLARVRERVAVLEHSLETVAAHVRLAGAYVEQGMLVRSELLRAEVELSRLEDLSSRARGLERVAEANLSLRLAADLSTSWHLAPLTDPAPLATALEDWLAGAAERRDLAAARRLLAAGDLEAKARSAGRRPKIGLTARRDWNDDRLFGSSGDSTTILAAASLDLFAGGRHRAAAAAAREEAEAARRDVEQFEEGIRLAIQSAHSRATSARERHQTARAAQEAAREAERITGERFKKGIVKTIDLLDATTQRREAQMRELEARAEAQLASLALAVEAGRRPETMLPPAATSETRTEP